MNNKISKARLLEELGKMPERVCRLESPQTILQNIQSDFRRTFNDLEDGYFEVDLQGRYIFVNQAVCRHHGKTLDELLGTDSLAHAPLKSKRRILMFFREIYRKGISAGISNCELINEKGELAYINIAVAMIRSENGTPMGFRGIARDRTLDRLKQLELERYREFVESIDDGCFETDLNGTLTFINEAMSKIHGYSRRELLGMNHRSFAPPEDARNIFRIFNLIYKTGIPSRVFDYNISTKDNTSRNLEISATLISDDQGRGIGFRGITRDRTERKAQELELERYRNFVESVDDACFEVDLAGNFTFFNNASCRVFGYPAEQLMGMNNRSYTSPETSNKIFRIFNKIYKSGKSAEVLDFEIRRGDGQIRYLDMSVSLVYDAQRTPIGFRGICRDVTDQKNAQKENERLTALLNEAQRLEALATLAAGVAHNFNNLLMSIQGYVSLLSMDTEPEHANHKRIKIIEDHIKKGSELTLELLSYANVNYNPDSKVDINQIVRSAVSFFKMSYNQIKIVELYAESVHDVAVDRKQIEHMLSNLLKNAVQAMPDGGSLFIETQNIQLQENFVKAYERAAGPYIKITVKDTGIGMDKATQERIFEPFFTTQNMGMATGLGLAAVYGVVKKHLGIIDVHSEKGHGAVFSIYLPAKVASTQPEAAPKAPDETQEAILIVDDEEVFIKLMEKMIGRMGYSILSASNGQEALEIFRSNKDRIALVVMDMIMPGISGDQLMETLQGIDPDVRVILVSGYIKDEKMKKITAQKRRAFLHKPFQQQALIEAIENLISS